MKTYVMSVKRECRDKVPADWPAKAANVAGVTLVGQPSGRTIRIETSEEGLHRLQSELGDFLHIEPIIEHHRLD